MKLIIKIGMFVMCLVFISCEEIFIGTQPKFINETEFEPALNIFGVLRPDSLYALPASFLIVGIVASTTNDTSSDWFIFDAEVRLKGETFNDTVSFFNQYDTLGQLNYFNKHFTPIEGSTYQLMCYKEGFDSVTTETTIPVKPVINAYQYDGSKTTIQLQNDPGIYMYDVYLYVNSDFLFQRVIPSQESVTTMVSFENTEKSSRLEIYSYDKNLADYYGSANEFIKPNTYREPFSSVTGGYGCVGSLNKIIVYPE